MNTFSSSPLLLGSTANAITGAGMTEVKAEVPMAEMLSYAPDLRSITGGQGEFTMEFERYEEVPAHLAAKVVDEARAEREAVKA